MFKRIHVLALWACIPAAVAAYADSVNAPVVKAGDTWTYRTTTEKGASGWNQTRDETTVSRVTTSTIYYTVKASGSSQPAKELFAGVDWSRARDLDGKETVVNKPLAFPLTPGKVWEVHYTEQHPNKAFKSEEWTASGRTYKAFWYVPEARRWVKSVEEYYGSGGVRNERYTGELESFKLAE